MSTFNDIDISCEQCGHEFRGTVWTAVNAKQDPELKDLLIGGELNMVMCPECAHVSFHENFLLYQDPDDELVAYVHPVKEEGRADELRAAMLEGFRQAQEVFEPEKRKDYEPLLFFGLTSLEQFVRDELSRIDQSDVAAALCREANWPLLDLRAS